MSYMNPDGSKDTLEQAVLSGRSMAVALSRLMVEGQKILVNLKDPNSVQVVQKKNGQILTRPATTDEIESQGNYDKIMDAMMKQIAV